MREASLEMQFTNEHATRARSRKKGRALSNRYFAALLVQQATTRRKAEADAAAKLVQANIAKAAELAKQRSGYVDTMKKTRRKKRV